MKLTPENLLRQWEYISYKNGGFLQINTKHYLEWHIGYQSINQRTLLLVCNTEIDAIESSKSMSVSRRRREKDNRWTLTFELLRDTQQDVFLILCCDIIEYSRSALDEQQALELVINRYKQWSRLLETQKSGFLDENLRKGLLGELLFLEHYLDNNTSKLNAILGWSGPDAADQDFIYSEGWYEIKSVGIAASSVSISSLEQLDSNQAGELVIMRIDKTTPEKNGAVSLNHVVYRIREKLALDAEASELFHNKLAKYGYIDIQEYFEPKYFYTKMQRYKVDENFPRLTSDIIPSGIISLNYSLSISALTNCLKG